MIPQVAVVSPWHSGTRTLVQWLHQETGVKPTYQHFLHFDKQLKAKYGGRGDLVHIPIRHPMSVAESWARRKKDVEHLIGQYKSMFDYLSREDPTLWKIEDLPRLAGTDDLDVERDRTPARVHDYKAIILERVVTPHQDFFKDYYSDL